jgi:hypothetical protein
MNYPTYDQTPATVAAASVVAISRWIDESPRNAARDREAATWGRIAKVQEEAGEVIREFIAYTGQNPRKPQDNDALIGVGKELLDVALTALAAYEHLTGHRGIAFLDLFEHIEYVRDRALTGKKVDPAMTMTLAEDESRLFRRGEFPDLTTVPRVLPNVSVTNAYDEEPTLRCPSCGSPEPGLFPALGGAGDPQMCSDPFHAV